MAYKMYKKCNYLRVSFEAPIDSYAPGPYALIWLQPVYNNVTKHIVRIKFLFLL